MADPNPERCGLYRSSNQGASYPVADLCAVEVFSLATFRGDSRVLAAGGNNGVYLTRDGGRSWKGISPAQNRELQPVMSLAIDPEDENVSPAHRICPGEPWTVAAVGNRCIGD